MLRSPGRSRRISIPVSKNRRSLRRRSTSLRRSPSSSIGRSSSVARHLGRVGSTGSTSLDNSTNLSARSSSVRSGDDIRSRRSSSVRLRALFSGTSGDRPSFIKTSTSRSRTFRSFGDCLGCRYGVRECSVPCARSLMGSSNSCSRCCVSGLRA